MFHLVGITATICVIILLTVLPFLPGRYDSLAMPLSVLAQLFGIVGLVLVPVGALWLASEHRSGNAARRYGFAITAFIVSSVVWLLLSFAAFWESVMLGVGAVVLLAYVVRKLLPHLKSLKTTTATGPSRVPWYLLIVPVAVIFIQLALARPVSEFSRNRAIRNSVPMIADIERYRDANGRYPLAVVSVQKDYSPSVIGIREYVYERSGDAYNLLFEQATFRLGTREFVMYNPRDQHAMTSHALDVLQLTPEQLALDQMRGHSEVHNAAPPHWKYFWFD